MKTISQIRKMLNIVTITLSVFIAQVLGHGMLLDPPNRSSLWRFDDRFPINYNDNENFCGGFNVQWGHHLGNCGVCGDVFSLPHPQPNENTGIYGSGYIVANYTSGQVIETFSLLTANHLGHISFSICELLDVEDVEAGEECFQPLKLADENDRFKVSRDDREILLQVQLPANYTCEHCVLRWHYEAGNNWGICEDGTGGLGCGPQETFRSCSDIAIF